MNEKGGSGKTTTTISLAAVLAERGFRILVVDLDPQASASLWLGRGREPGLYRAIAEKRDLEPFVRATAVAGLDIIAGSRELAAVDDLRGRIGIQTALKRALARLHVRWDIVLIDCPPNLGLLSVNALAAADEVVGRQNLGRRRSPINSGQGGRVEMRRHAGRVTWHTEMHRTDP